MLELVIVLAVLYGLSVLLTWGFIRLVFEDTVPPKWALVPGFYIILVFLALGGGRTHRRRTPKQEIEIEGARHHWGPHL